MQFPSRALRQRRSYLIYLPAGYDAMAAAGDRFPVLYLLHGSPGRPRSFVDIAQVTVDVDVLLAAHRIRPLLIVMPDGSDGSFESDTEWANTPHGSYEGFVLNVVSAVDARWPTQPIRSSRALAGNSEGAYAAFNIALHHLGTFGIAESWSGYFKQRRHGPFKHVPRSLMTVNSPLKYVASLAGALRRRPLHALLYVGEVDRDLDQSRKFATALAAAGGDVHYAEYPGRHSWRLWRSQAPNALVFADRWFGVRGR